MISRAIPNKIQDGVENAQPAYAIGSVNANLKKFLNLKFKNRVFLAYFSVLRS